MLVVQWLQIVLFLTSEIILLSSRPHLLFSKSEQLNSPTCWVTYYPIYIVGSFREIFCSVSLINCGSLSSWNYIFISYSLGPLSTLLLKNIREARMLLYSISPLVLDVRINFSFTSMHLKVSETYFLVMLLQIFH